MANPNQTEEKAIACLLVDNSNRDNGIVTEKELELCHLAKDELAMMGYENFHIIIPLDLLEKKVLHKKKAEIFCQVVADTIIKTSTALGIKADDSIRITREVADTLHLGKELLLQRQDEAKKMSGDFYKILLADVLKYGNKAFSPEQVDVISGLVTTAWKEANDKNKK